MWLIAALLLLVITAVIYTRSNRGKPLPGPVGLPVVGSALSINFVRPDLKYLQWQKIYGRIFRVKIGPATVVCLSDPELIRDAFGRTSATGRQASPLLELFLADKGVIFSSGDLWQQTRRFTLFHLRNFGMGKSKIEDSITNQIDGFVNTVLTPSNGKAIVVDHTINVAIVNTIWNILSSEHFNIDDSRILNAIALVSQLAEGIGMTALLYIFFPFASKLWTEVTVLKHVTVKFQTIIRDLFVPAIEEHRNTYQPDSEPRDYIDCLLEQQMKNPEMFTERHLHRTLLDLFFAGMDTTASSIKWALCLLCTFPNVQKKLQEEIDRVIGSDRVPSFSDKTEMPYTMAFIMELLRFGDIAPMGVQHVANEEFQLDGYTVPKHAEVVSLLGAVHRDPNLFTHPDRFLPERFLDENGKVQPNKSLMPFSVGRRACLGEALARTELFLFLVSIMQKFSIRFPEGFQHNFSFKENRRFIREPTEFQIVPDIRGK